MKKLLILSTVLSLVLLSGCTKTVQNSATVFALDTVVNIKGNTNTATINSAVDLVRQYESALSRTKEDSEIALLNKNGAAIISDETLSLIKLSLEYSEKTDGKFDITIAPVSSLWDFNSDNLPQSDDIKAALPQVDYKKITLDGNYVSLGGTTVDLGAVAKGYITQKVYEYLKAQNVPSATINLGGNVAVLGEEFQNVGIKDPNGSGIAATLKLKNALVSTAGVYERYIEKDGKRYHHILDTKTGYGVQTDVLSASVICDDGAKGDILATACVLLSSQKALDLINSTDGAEAIIITADGKIHISSGIYCENGYYLL